MAQVILLVGVLCSMASVALVVFALTNNAGRQRAQVLENLQRSLGGPIEEQPTLPSSKGGLVRLAYALTPAGSVEMLDRQLTRVGRPAAWPVDRVVAAKLLGGATGAILGLLLVLKGPSLLVVLAAVAMTALGWFLPELLLYSKATERAQQIALELPDTMDQMVIAMEAGLGFEASMARTAQNGKGPLAAELRRTMQDLQMGAPRAYAYEGLATRTNVPDVARFVRSIIQGEKHGISVADVLRSQAEEQRLKRKQRAEEKAMQIPVKVIFPLMLCILPVLFIVLLGPAVINTIAAFR